ncbi:MAG: linear amide C-N hydrolase [Bdellovibrionales bacterium]
MFRGLILLTFIFNSLTQSAGACTIFRSPFDGDAQTAHNVDWYDVFPNVKAIIVQNPAKMHKTAFLLGAPVKAAEWTSRYKSMTFTIGGAEFPVSGFNDKGLFMAILVMPSTVYPAADDVRPALSVTQFVQYNLDRSATVADVIASGQVIRPYSKALKMHYFVCDRSAKCAVLQYINGALAVYSGADLPYDILTNSPYPASVAAAKACTLRACTQPDTSLWRFGQAALKLGALSNKSTFVESSFDILNHVAQTAGITTRYQLTYDPAHSRMNFRKGGQANYAWVDIDLSSIRCNVVRKVIAVDAINGGDASGAWQDLTESLQNEVALGTGLPPAQAVEAGRYPFVSTACQ